MPLLSLIIVNFNAAGHVLRCVESLQKQAPPGGATRSEEWLELLVVDNASAPDDRALLATLPTGVRVLQNDGNLGYGRAINRGIRETQGELVGFLNPDVLVFPGALATLVEALRTDRAAGAVGPRTWWDERRTFLLPPLPRASLAWYVVRWLANVVPPFGRWLSRRLARWSATFWATPDPLPADNLAGSFLLTRRSVLDAVGGFDPRFHLYFEDTDWCRRLRRAGLRLSYVPGAEIAHFFNQSAQQIAQTAWQWLVASERAYLDKYYGRLGMAVYALCGRLGPRLSRWSRPGPVPAPVDLGASDAPVRLDCSDLGRPVFLQVSLHWLFLDAAFAASAEPLGSFPLALWDRLAPTRYYARVLDPTTFRVLRSWTWEKI